MPAARAPSLHPGEQNQRHDAQTEGEGDDRDAFEGPRPAQDLEGLLGCPPAVGVAFDETEDEGHQSEGDEQEAWQIEACLSVFVSRLPDEVQRARDGQDADRDVDEERPVP